MSWAPWLLALAVILWFAVIKPRRAPKREITPEDVDRALAQLPPVNGPQAATWTPDMVHQFALSNQDQQAVLGMAEGYVKVINESLSLAVRSKAPGTKASRLIIAKTKMDELELHLQHYPFIKLEGAPKMRAQIEALNDEFSEAGYFDPKHEKARRKRTAPKAEPRPGRQG